MATERTHLLRRPYQLAGPGVPQGTASRNHVVNTGGKEKDEKRRYFHINS